MSGERKYEDFVARRALWVSCLGSDDQHGVQMQIHQGVVDAAVYRLSIKMRNLAPRASDDSGVELNGLFFRMVDNSFFHAQTAAIRRLTDASYPIASAGKGRDTSVYSLAALLKDMHDWAPQMSRRWLIDAGADLNAQFSWRERERHDQIDWLSGTTADFRSDDDLLDSSFFDYLLSRLETACASIHRWATTHVAHAATPASRKEVEQATISWLSLWAAWGEIAAVAHVTRVWVLEGAHVVVLPKVLADVAAWMDRPLVEPLNLEAIRGLWRDTETETLAWPQSLAIVQADYADYLANS